MIKLKIYFKQQINELQMQSGSIFSGSPEWNYSQFRLQLILSHPNIEILSIQKNPSAQSYFESKEGYFKIDSAIDVSQEKDVEINYLKSNTKKESIFKCGRIQQECKLQDGIGSPKIYRMLLFKIAVKNLIPIYQSNSITKEDLNNFTQDYDSVYLSTRKEEMSIYDHQYFLRSTSQYIWQYDIQYRYLNTNQPASKVRRWSPENKKCQECQVNKAYWYCVDEKQLFCRDCFEETHKGRFRNPHQKQLISPFNCHKKCHRSAHNQNPLEFYCFDCKDLKCAKCLADSSHGLNRYPSTKTPFPGRQSEQALHKKGIHEFAPIRDLIKSFQQKQRQINSEIKQRLTEKLRQVEAVISLKSRIYHEKLKKLQQELTLSIIKLKKQSRKEINEVMSVHIELKRKFDEVLWIEKFVSYNQDILDAESNIQLKQVFTSYVNHLNAEEYFKRIEQKISQMKPNE